MPNLALTGDQLQVLKAAWEYLMEADDYLEVMAEALEIPPEDRKMDEDGEERPGYELSEDPVYKRIEGTGSLLMNLE